MNKTVTVNPETALSDAEAAAPLAKKWESLDITSRFIFAKVMQQKEICLPLLQRLFPELDITDVEYAEAEKTVEGSIGSKAVRFDVYVKTPRKYAFTMEMQVENEDNLPKRTRYYSAMMCEDLLAAGATYASLPPAYVVVLCPFDLFHKGMHRYTFSYRCSEDSSVFLGDGSSVVFLNSKGTADDVSSEVLSFLNYMEGIVIEEDPYIKMLDEAVKKAKKNTDWRREYMLYEMELAHEKELARKEGRKEGIKEGIKEGARMMLISQVEAGIGKGLDSAAIADRLMTKEDSIRPIYDLILAMPEASPEEILQALKQQD
jgi:predicted transposase/invertase (TIGR01784 family)